MIRKNAVAVAWAAILAAGLVIQTSTASTQTFDSYRCADGTRFILAFYPGDKRAFMTIDGRPATLNKSFALPGRHYSGSGVSLDLTATGALIKHLRRPATACELS